MPRSAARARRKAASRLTAITVVPVLVLHPHDQIVAGDAGIVDQDVELRPAPPRRPRPAHRPRAGSARSAGSDVGALAELAGQRRRAPRSRVPESATVAPCACSALAIGAADAARGAGDQGGLAGQIEHGRVSFAQPASSAEALRCRPACRRAAPSASGRDALDQAGQHLAGAELDERGRRRAPAMPVDALAPAHRAGDLLDQQPADLVGIGDRRGGDIGDERHRGRARSRPSASASAIASAAGCISGQWKGARDRQQDRALGALAPWPSRSPARPPPWRRRSPPGPARCRWRRRRPRPAPPRRRPPRAVVEVEAEQRRHGALADRHRRLHRLAAQLQQPRGVGEAERAGRGQRGIFAEGMAGDEGGLVGRGRRRPRLRARAAPRGSPPSAPAGRSRSGSARPPAPRASARDSFWPSASSTSSNTSRAAGKASASASPMPTAWLPWPGKMKARLIRGSLPSPTAGLRQRGAEDVKRGARAPRRSRA